MDFFLSKLAFGFVIAQVAPGIILLLGMRWSYRGEMALDRIGDALPGDAGVWAQLAVGGAVVGLVLDGLSWAGRAVIEAWADFRNRMPTELLPFRGTIRVLTLGPLLLLGVMLCTLLAPTRKLVLSENLPDVEKDKLEQFKWLQDFYLYPAQFFANSALALTILSGVGIVKSCKGRGDGTLCLILWLAVGLLWLLALRTFAALFWAELRIVEPKWTPQRAFDRTDEEHLRLRPALSCIAAWVWITACKGCATAAAALTRLWKKIRGT